MDFVKNDWDVRSIPTSEAKEWVLYKHYAHRLPCIVYSFGLYLIGGGQTSPLLSGVCTFGIPPSKDLILGSMGEAYKGNFLELNRLVVNDGLPRNALSFFVSSCLKMLPKPMVVVSYADTSMGHHGYIYQATNWIYTGLSDKRTDWVVEGLEGKHSRHLADGTEKVGQGNSKEDALKEKYGDRVKLVERPRKHRYFQFLGDKRQVRQMLRDFHYPIIPEYPKGDNTRYDASYETTPNLTLF